MKNVIICGGGIAGLASAWWLDRLGYRVHVVERAPQLRAEGYMIDFFGSGYEAAEMMGLLPALHARAYDVERALFLDGEGRPKAALAYDLLRRSQDGRLMAIMRGDLEAVLYEAVADRVEVTFGATVEHVEHRGEGGEGVEVTLDNGSTERADLLVGADGIHSRVRKLLFGPEERHLRYLGFHVASYFFEDETVAAALGDEVQVQMLSVPGRQIGLYKIRDGRIAALFAHPADSDRAPADPVAELQERYGDLGWLVPRALAARPPAEQMYFDVVAQIEVPRWHQGQVVLVGDACQAVSLLAGQGASMAVGGACVLASELSEADSLDEGLSRYEARMRPLIEEKQAAGRRTAAWFVPASPLRVALRNTMMRLAHTPGFRWVLERPLRSDGKSVVSGRDHHRLGAIAA